MQKYFCLWQEQQYIAETKSCQDTLLILVASHWQRRIGFTDLREIWQQRYNEPYNSPIIQGAKFRVDEF